MTKGSTGGTRADAIYQALRADVLNGHFEPGSRLTFAFLAARYDASTGVLREALPRLVEQGLVTSEPQLGFRVVSVSEADIWEVVEARVLVESECLRQSIASGGLAWESQVLSAHHTMARTPLLSEQGGMSLQWVDAHARFHQTLLSGCVNQQLLRMAESLRVVAEVHRCWGRPAGEAHHRDVPAEHRRICDAALARDDKAAVAELTSHFELTAQLVAEALKGVGADDPA